MKIVLLNNVTRDNVVDGNLQSGVYNISFSNCMSFAPLYKGYDGNKWDDGLVDDGDEDITMCVHVRVADYDVKDDNNWDT